MREFLRTRKGRIAAALMLSVLLALGAAWAAFADQIVNTIDNTIDNTKEVITTTVGTSTEVGFFIHPTTGDGDVRGCNVKKDATATITFTLPDKVTVSPTSLVFADCGPIISATFSSNIVGSYNISVNATGGQPGSLWDTAPAAFTLIVQASTPSDTTPPVITPTVSGTLGNNDWYVSDVVVTWTVVDNESEITSKSGCDETVITEDTAGTTLTCKATSAGGTSSASVTIKRDATAPKIEYAISGTKGFNEWYISPVTVTFTCKDETSKVASCRGPVVLDQDGMGQYASGQATDNAGNTAEIQVGPFNIDQTPPEISYTISGTKGFNEWYISPVTVTFTCKDETSKVASCSPDRTLNTDGVYEGLKGEATDNAGNTSSVDVETIKIDKTKPTITYEIVGTKGANGWYISPVTVKFTCTDETSSVASCSPDLTLNTDGVYEGLKGEAADNAGNTSSVDVKTINIDMTPPTLSNLIASPNPAPVNTSVTFSAVVGDNLSGLAQVVYEYSVDGGVTWTPKTAASAPWSVSVTFNAAYVVLVRARAVDKAGNVSGEDAILLAVYDPSGGFVTGGGWINSPAGAYTADPTLTGKATFGFVAKYQKGANVPVGNTEFQFHVANFKFKSTAYEWLVVAGPKAQFKGVGTVNGAGSYGFMLTAIDGQISGGGGVDKFRIKIWDKATGEIVYDNQMGASDAADPTTAVMGGSIVIHK